MEPGLRISPACKCESTLYLTGLLVVPRALCRCGWSHLAVGSKVHQEVRPLHKEAVACLQLDL